jgi:hypothetical protein
MFERFTEKARRVIFFARYEASHYGSPCIETDHLLLGLVREDKTLYRWIPKARPPDLIRQQIEGWIQKRPRISTSVDLPLSQACKRVLHRGQDEADRLHSEHIGTAHLFLGLLQEPDCPAAKLLQELGADLDKLRVEFGERAQQQEAQFHHETIHGRGYRPRSGETVEIRGAPWNADYVRDVVKRCREYNWHWRKAAWTPHDVVIERKSGRVSFNLSLAEGSTDFELLKGGWKKDHCAICRWELFQSNDDSEHGTGYTNGLEWLCTECYEKFLARPNFFSSSHPEIT